MRTFRVTISMWVLLLFVSVCYCFLFFFDNKNEWNLVSLLFFRLLSFVDTSIHPVKGHENKKCVCFPGWIHEIIDNPNRDEENVKEKKKLSYFELHWLLATAIVTLLCLALFKCMKNTKSALWIRHEDWFLFKSWELSVVVVVVVDRNFASIRIDKAFIHI